MLETRAVTAFLAVPPIVRNLALLYVFTGLASFAAVAYPTSDQMAIEPKLVAGPVSLLVAAALLRWGARLRRRSLHVLAGVETVALSASVVIAADSLGAAVVMQLYTFVLLYVAHYFKPRVVAAHQLLVVVSVIAAVVASGHSHLAVSALLAVVPALVVPQLVAGPTRALVSQAKLDPLTAVLNRRGLEVVAERVFAAADRARVSMVVLMVDVDHLKGENDRHGHAAGDRLLRAIADGLRGELRTADVCGRASGDEFVVLLHGATLEAANSYLERVRSVESRWSAGAYQRQAGEPFDYCVTRADRAMYAAKRAKRAEPRADRQPPALTVVTSA